MATPTTVLVTGATGFVAIHTIDQLLRKGYIVVGTVRSFGDSEDVMKKFVDKFGSLVKLTLEIVQDGTEDGAFDHVFSEHLEIKWIVHSTYDFSQGTSGVLEKDYLWPALNNTLSILRTIYRHTIPVEKVMLTSSFAAVANMNRFDDPTFIHTEAMWSPVEWRDTMGNETKAMFACKKLVEKVAWEFVVSNRVWFSLNTVVPPPVFGPQLFDEDAKHNLLNYSTQVIKSIMQSSPNETSLLDSFILPSVDVRDIAAVQILAMEMNIPGERLMPYSNDVFSKAIIANLISKKYPQLREKIVKGDEEHLKSEKISSPKCDNSRTLALLGGYEFISFERQVTDTVDQLLRVQSI